METRTADRCGNSAHVLLPKRFRGKRFQAELVAEAEQWRETVEAKPCGNSAHILVPKRFRGKTFRVELLRNHYEERECSVISLAEALQKKQCGKGGCRKPAQYLYFHKESTHDDGVSWTRTCEDHEEDCRNLPFVDEEDHIEIGRREGDR